MPTPSTEDLEEAENTSTDNGRGEFFDKPEPNVDQENNELATNERNVFEPTELDEQRETTPRRSSRVTRRPARFDDFVLGEEIEQILEDHG